MIPEFQMKKKSSKEIKISPEDIYYAVQMYKKVLFFKIKVGITGNKFAKFHNKR